MSRIRNGKKFGFPPTVALVMMTTLAINGCGNPDQHDVPDESNAIKVKIVLVTMFEIGADSGDVAGEFQLWYERRHLDQIFPFQGEHDLHFSADSGILAIVTGAGTAKAASSIMALGMDPRFDLTQSYWLVAGIAGFDPNDASVGSAAWAEYLVDGDLAHEIDAREKPDDWAWGYIARHTLVPFDPNKPTPRGEVFHANPTLMEWAYQLTKDVQLPDSEEAAAARALYVNHPNARKPPFVLKGDNLAALTFWHGEILNNWANAWVDYWSDGNGKFVSSAMEETGTFQSLTYLDKIHRADIDRVMVLRTASNYTMPPPGVTAAENLLAENEGYSGLNLAVESGYRVGSIVVDEILDNWAIYQQQIPAVVSIAETGKMQNAAINEASGFSVSHFQPGRLWTVNDGGSPPIIYALNHDGTEHGSVQLTNATNVDWEDMASFDLDGNRWLLVADVGDNLAVRDHVTLYIVAEPDLSKTEMSVSWQVNYRYPDGPRDVEAVAVDPVDQLVYLLAKRTVPARLYSLPLRPTADNEIVTATFLGTLDSIPQPTQDDLDRAAAEQNWHWQSTAMDFSADGKTALVLTYRAAYLYDRHDEESWHDALQRSPSVIKLGDIRGAESAALTDRHVFVTVEAVHAPIYRIPRLNTPPPPQRE